MTAVAFTVLAGAGAVIRWHATRRHDRPQGWPIGTLTVNVAGSFALGLLASAGDAVQTAVGTGGVGALTTWSGFAAHLADPSRSAASRSAYGAVTLAAGVAAAWCGLLIGG